MDFGRNEIIRYVSEAFSADPEYLWIRSPEAFILRHAAGGKWFALVMSVRRDRLGLAGEGTADVLNVKCGELLLGSILGRPGFRPAYHMNKSQWVSILLDGTVSPEEIRDLLNISYEMTGRLKKAPRP